MINMSLAARHNSKTLANYDKIDPDNPILGVIPYQAANGHWNAETRTSAGTTTLVAARGNEGIVLTDLILTSDKVNLATVSVVITDGVNSKTIVTAHVTDAPCNIALGLNGRLKSWKGTRIDMTTVGVVKSTVTLGYYRIPEDYTETYEEWVNDQ